jgi:HlyD family secretion protein
MKRILIIVTAAVVFVGTAYIIWGGSEDGPATPVGQFTRIEQVTRGDLNLVVSANGVVQPINKVEVKSKASGQIEEINIIEGQVVEKGFLMLKLDQRTTRNDYEQAKADLAVAEANLKQAENNFGRNKELFAKGLLSEQERDASNLEYVRAQAQLVKAKASLASAEERLADTRIVAPISGTILTKNVELGQIIASGVSNVGGGTTIASIADMQEVYVETSVDEVDIGKVGVGQRATVIADAYPDDRFTGQVERIAPLGKTQQNVTTFNVVVLVRNVGGKLKAGMSASVDIEVFNQRAVLLISNEALKDPRSEQGRQIMEAAKLTLPVDSSQASGQGGGAPSGGGMRERFANMSEEQRKAFRERMMNMSPEERQQMFQRFGGGAGGEGGGFMRRRPTANPENEVKWRLVSARKDGAFAPKLIKVGPSNFEQSVVLEGLAEGDEVEIVTISRAKVAQEQFNERMRSMNSFGGGTSQAGRAASGTGRR